MAKSTLKYSDLSIWHPSELLEAAPYSSVRGLMEAHKSHPEKLWLWAGTALWRALPHSSSLIVLFNWLVYVCDLNMDSKMYKNPGFQKGEVLLILICAREILDTHRGTVAF